MSGVTTRSSIRIKEGEELFQKLGVAFSDYRIFSSSHPRFLESCQSFLGEARNFFEAHAEQEHLLFVHRKGQIYFRGVPLSVLTPPAIKLARFLKEKKVEGIRFSPACGLEGLRCALDGLHSRFEGNEPMWKVANRQLERESLKGDVSFFADYELSALDTFGENVAPAEEEPYRGSSILCLPQLAVPLEIYKSTLAALHDLMTLVGSGGDAKFDPLLEVTRKVASGMVDMEPGFLPLATVHYSDQFTFNHSVNVCLLVTAAMKPLVSNPEKLVQLGEAALLHDLGKSLVSEELFYTQEIPKGEARDEIERHPMLGAEVLQDAGGIDPLAVTVAFDHHRRPGGSGYPSVRRKRPIDIVTSLVAAADIFEALTAERPYKKSLSPSEAFQVFLRLPEAKGLETPLRLLYDALSPFPPGTFVELDNGETAVVTRARPHAPHTPCVRIVSAQGDNMDISSEETDLAKAGASGTRPPRIVRAVPSPWDLSGDEAEESRDTRSEEPNDFERRVENGTLLASEG